MAQTIGTRIRDLRKLAGLSQIEFADLLGIRQSSLSQIEKGITNPSLETLERITQTFEVSYDYLFGAEAQPGSLVVAREGEGQPAEVTAYRGERGQFALVEQAAMGGRFAGFADAVVGGEAITYPGLEGGVAVHVEGTSMEPTLRSGDVLLCSPLGPEGYTDNRVYVVVTAEGALVKRVVDRTRSEGILLLKSDNRGFAPVQLRPSEVLGAYAVRRRITADLSGPDDLYARLSEQEQALRDLHQHQQRLERLLSERLNPGAAGSSPN